MIAWKEWNSTYSSREYEAFLDWSNKLGISVFGYEPERSSVRINLKDKRLWHCGRISLQIFYVALQIILLTRALQNSDTSTELLLTHIAWISGPMYGITPMVCLLIQGSSWCETLNEVFWVEKHIMGKIAE